MDLILPLGNGLSIPARHLPYGNNHYAQGMDEDIEGLVEKERQRRYAVRRKRLEKLLKDFFDDNQSKLAALVGYQPNYISRLLSAGKSFGEDAAIAIEVATKIKIGWLSREDEAPTSAGAAPGAPVVEQEWPFENIKVNRFHQLSPKHKMHVERTLDEIISGYEVPAVAKRKRRRTR